MKGVNKNVKIELTKEQKLVNIYVEKCNRLIRWWVKETMVGVLFMLATWTSLIFIIIEKTWSSWMIIVWGGWCWNRISCNCSKLYIHIRY